MIRHTLIAVLIVSSGATTAFAQQKPAPARPHKGSVEFDVGYRTTSIAFDDTATPPINVEPANIAIGYGVPAELSFSGGAGWRVWKQLGVGIAVSRYSGEVTADVSATIPHPFFFGRGRQIEGAESGLTRDEFSVAFQVRGVVPISSRLSLTLFGGPAWISATQDVVTGIHYADAYPYDTAEYRSADVTSSKQSRLGVGVGGDLAYFFSKQIGVGFGARLLHANIELPAMGGAALESKVGGVDVVGGLRVRF